jgi:phosphatidylglycerol:prolipoprotein diacylglycerol transferase
MLPDLIKIGPLAIHSYGLMLAVSFLAGIWVLEHQAKHQGLPKEKITDLGLVIMLASVVGSRAMYVLTHLGEYSDNWLSVLAVWEGGLTFYGGFIFGTLAAVFYSKKLGVSFWHLADMAAPAFALGLGLGRIGCFLNGCCFGKPSELPWAVTFPDQGMAGLAAGCRVHPTQLYEALFGFALFGLLWALRKRKIYDGFKVSLMFLLYGAWRFIIDYFRFYEQSQRWVLGLTNNQWISLTIILFALLAGLVLKLKHKPR